jgi:hypothetical protein
VLYLEDDLTDAQLVEKYLKSLSGDIRVAELVLTGKLSLVLSI